MRVLLVANTLPPRDISGAGEQVLQLAAGLRERGVEVEVLGRDGSPNSPKVLFALTVVPGTWRALRRFRPDVVQVHESDAALSGLLVVLMRAFLKPRPRLVALLQVSYLEEIRAVRPLRFEGRVLGVPGVVEKRFRWTKGPLQVVLGWLTAKLAELIFVPSRQTGREVEKDYHVTGTFVLPNATGGREIEPVQDAGDGEGDDLAPGYLLYVGRLRIRKGVEVLLEAMARSEVQGAPLIIAGTGEQEDALRQRVVELGLQNVIFLGRCSATRVRSLLANAACLVVPSTYEGMPLVILEAMDSGTPVVATTVSGIPEVVVDGETGWLVPSEDPPRLAAALTEVLSDPAEAVRRGKAGQERRARLYTPAAIAETWLNVVQGQGHEKEAAAEDPR